MYIYIDTYAHMHVEVVCVHTLHYITLHYTSLHHMYTHTYTYIQKYRSVDM